MALKFSNNASSLLTADISVATPTVTVTSGTGALFPTTSDGTFLITVQDSMGNNEIMLCTERNADSFTVTRAQEGTLARSFSIGAVVENRFTAGSMSSFARSEEVQPIDAGLTSISGLTTAADNIIYTTAADTYATASCTAAGRALLDDANAAAQRTTLGLGGAAVLGVGTTAGTVCAGDDSRLSIVQRRNRLCNGDFRVDNINAGSAVTPAAMTYVVDNVRLVMSQASKMTSQRVSSVLNNCAYAHKITVVAAVTPGVADVFQALSGVEGFDISDLLFGTANAKPITLSFSLKVSVSGAYAFSLHNHDGSRTYTFTETLVANTQKDVVVTIPGDTTGIWKVDNSAAMYFRRDYGAGSNYATGTVNTWQGGTYYTVTGATSLISTNGATYEISGIQIEKGSFATSFEVLPYQQAEAWCQRYHPTFVAAGAAAFGWNGLASATTRVMASITFPRVRTTPTGAVVSDATKISVSDGVTNTACTVVAVSAASDSGVQINCDVASGLTQYRPYRIYANGAVTIRLTGAEL